MILSEDVIRGFVKATNDVGTKEEAPTVFGTIVEQLGNKYVQLDGSGEMTPFETTVEVEAGQRVIVSVKNHSATVTGNITNPSASVIRVGELETSLEQTAEAIRLEAKNDILALESSLEVTAGAIRQEVSDGDAKLQSSIEQTASAIRQEVSDEVNELNSSIEQTASAIRSEVADEVAGLNSSIEQTAGEIRSEVSASVTDINKALDDIGIDINNLNGDITDLNSSISQTATQIRSEVNASITNLNGDIGDINKTLGEIDVDIEDLNGAVVDLNSSISQTASQIRSEVSASLSDVNGKIATVQSSVTQNADSIETLVEQQTENDRKFTQITTDINGIKVEYTGSININDKFIVDKDGTIRWTVDNSPVQAQYSVDGTSSWHSSPSSGDMYARYSYDGGNTWTTAVRIQGLDGKSVKAQYSVTGTGGWHDTYVASDYYVRYSYDDGATWTAAIKLRGSDVIAEYSADGNSWHDFYQSTDIYMRYSYDGGLTWGDAIRIRGEDGEDGTNGTNGSDASVTYNNIKYALNRAYAAGTRSFNIINEDSIETPVLYGGRIVGTHIYAGESEETFSTIDADGFKLYCADDVDPKAHLYVDSDGANIYLKLGAGDNTGYNYFMIRKDSSEVEMLYHLNSSKAIGFRMDLATGYIYVNGILTADPNYSGSQIRATFA